MTYQIITAETDPMTLTLSGYRMTRFVPGWVTVIDL